MSAHHRNTRELLSKHIIQLRGEIDVSNAVLVEELLRAAYEQTVRLHNPDRRTRQGKQLSAINDEIAALRRKMIDYCTEYHK